VHVWDYMSAVYKNGDSYLIICTNFFPNTERIFDRASQMLHRGSGYYYYSCEIVEHFVIFHFAGFVIKSKIFIITLTLIFWETIRTSVAGSFLSVLLMVWCISRVVAFQCGEIVICADGIRKKLCLIDVLVHTFTLKRKSGIRTFPIKSTLLQLTQLSSNGC